MNESNSINASIHEAIVVKKGDYFLKIGHPCLKIGRLASGVFRGGMISESGEEITTHFFQAGDMVLGSLVPNANATMSIQALEDSTISVASFNEVMAHVNKDIEITSIVNKEFQQLSLALQSRLVSLLHLNATDKYALFLKEYPGLLNRIPHYYIAQYLGITPTQLSRVRRQFSRHL